MNHYRLHRLINNMIKKSIILPDENATLLLGSKLAAGLQGGLVVYLQGEIGAGKTTLVRGLLRHWDQTQPIKSPTYTLVESYQCATFDVHHFDLYRLNNPHEWEDAGLNDFFSLQAVCLIEWPEKMSPLLPPPDWRIELSLLNQGRLATLSALSLLGQKCLQKTSVLSIVS